MTAPDTLILHAHAKLNLALAVGPPQPPRGYHPIASWFVGIELHDTLSLHRLPDGARSQHLIRWAADAPKPTPIDWPAEKDLAVRAHALLERQAGRTLPVQLTLDKRTPVGGGLGGGSSDAAAAFRGINQLFGLGFSTTQLREFSAQLGSDIAFFLDESSRPLPALVTGFGEHIERLSTGVSASVLLIIPPFGCPTGPVYHAFDRAPTTSVDIRRVRALVAVAAEGHLPSRDLFNDLAAPACAVEPRLADMLSRLNSAAGPETSVHVTGSGSTMFCLPPPDLMASTQAAVLKACPEAIALPTRLLSPG